MKLWGTPCVQRTSRVRLRSALPNQIPQTARKRDRANPELHLTCAEGALLGVKARREGEASRWQETKRLYVNSGSLVPPTGMQILNRVLPARARQSVRASYCGFHGTSAERANETVAYFLHHNRYLAALLTF